MLIEDRIRDEIKLSYSLDKQRSFFKDGQTRKVATRIQNLKRLKAAIEQYSDDIVQALKSDLKKPGFEAHFEIIGVVEEIKHALKHIKRWAKTRRVKTPAYQFFSTSKVSAEPVGSVLILGPWNYPVNLMLVPLVSAIAAGNCAVLKPSEMAPKTSALLREMLEALFKPEFVAVLEGGIETSQFLLSQPFDHIFFTGSTRVGEIVMTAAAKHITPVTLELGGKSPCIVDHTVHIEHAAKRIAWGKFSNAGQTCTAPDYLLVDRRIKADLIEAIKQQIKLFYGDCPKESNSYARIVNAEHFHRLVRLFQSGQIAVGGESDFEDLYISPSVIDSITWADSIMQEEIFGPILPVIEYDDLDQAIANVNRLPKPLAIYIFSRDRKTQDQLLERIPSGGGCINDTVMHLTVPTLPFGGVGASGFGRYHGKAGFDNFSHQRGILNKSCWLDLKWRYPPYKQKKKG
jgi:aldehyde dehydrogenase (NAD+)